MAVQERTGALEAWPDAQRQRRRHRRQRRWVRRKTLSIRLLFDRETGPIAYPSYLRHNRRWILIPVTLIGLLLAFAALAVVAALLSRDSLRDGVNELSQAVTAVHQGDRATATQSLDKASSDFSRAHSTLTVWWTKPAEIVPGVSEQLRALQSVAGAGSEVCAAGLDVSKVITSKGLPHGKALITMLRRLQGPLMSAAPLLAEAKTQVSGARSSLLLPPISGPLDDAETKVSQAVHDDQVAIAAVTEGLQFLGGDGPRSYFLAVQTEAESRASGGVIGNYGIVTADDGTLHLTLFGTTGPLESKGDLATRKLIAPADYLARYGQFEPSLHWANVPMSPDFPTVADVIENLYPQEGGSPVDGVISVDPFALSHLLKATGPVVVEPWPQPITANNAAAILLHDEYNRLTGTARTDFLGDVTRKVWERFTTGNLPNLETLIRDLSPAFAHKDLLIASTSPAAENLIRQIGVSGAFSPPANSDFLAVTTQNSGENKIDWYLRRSFDYQASYAPSTGAIRATLTVSLHNLAPTSGQNTVVIGSPGRKTTPGENRLYMTIYTPWIFTQAKIDGHPLSLSASRELGVWADSAFVTIPPGGTTTISVELTGHLQPGSPYRLTMSRQPMVAPDKMQVGVLLPAGDHFSQPTDMLSLADGDREARARFELQSNTSMSAAA